MSVRKLDEAFPCIPITNKLNLFKWMHVPRDKLLSSLKKETMLCFNLYSLIFYTLLQNLDRYSRKRWTAMQIKEYKREMWMIHENVPGYLRKRIRQHEQYKWQNTRIVEEETLICNLPKYIRRDVKRDLCLALLTKVGIFHLYI